MIGTIHTDQSTLNFDFGTDKTDRGWTVVNDGVMGGRSNGTIAYTSESMVFQGTLSLENNGGFSRIKHRTQQPDMSGFSEVVLRVKGDGRQYALMLQSTEAFFRPYHRAYFQTKKGKWTTITLPLDQFKHTVMGRDTGNPTDLAYLKRVTSLGVILSDKQAGPFRLEIDHIEFR
ncbi:MAG: CIA30 family protein [Bacteroidota bacterium]